MAKGQEHSKLAPRRSALSAAERRTYTIGELAREFDLTLRALRFYEDRGLLHPKRQGTTRIYSAGDHARLSVILKGKQLGFTLAEIETMLSSDDRAEAQAADLRLSLNQVEDQIAHLERQRADIDEALAKLYATRAKLAA